MRLFEQRHIPYRAHCYLEAMAGCDGVPSGAEVARLLGQDPARVYKTLVAVGKSGGKVVFVIPVEGTLDLKQAAKAAGEKSVAMLPQKELLPLTGYVHGGCSPVGMKKAFPTFLDQSAAGFETIVFSAGKIGYQIEAAPDALEKLIRVRYAALTKA